MDPNTANTGAAHGLAHSLTGIFWSVVSYVQTVPELYNPIIEAGNMIVKELSENPLTWLEYQTPEMLQQKKLQQEEQLYQERKKQTERHWHRVALANQERQQNGIVTKMEALQINSGD